MANESKGGAAVAEAPAKPADKTSPRAPAPVAPVKTPEMTDVETIDNGDPRLGEDVFYIVGKTGPRGEDSPNKGERRAAKISYVWPDGTVNLMIIAGRHNDAPGASTGMFVHPGCRYDAAGAPGTWHREEDPAAAIPCGKPKP